MSEKNELEDPISASPGPVRDPLLRAMVPQAM